MANDKSGLVEQITVELIRKNKDSVKVEKREQVYRDGKLEETINVEQTGVKPKKEVKEIK